MYIDIKSQIRSELENATGERLGLEDIQDSPIADLASSIAFKLAPKWKKSPDKIATEISEKIKPREFIAAVEATNGYINFFLDYSHIMQGLLKKIKKKGDDYGRGDFKDKKIVLEHTSINPSGPIHIGRLRNSLIGDSLSRILRFYGYTIETHYFVNDVGKQIAIIAQGFKEGLEPDIESIKNYAKYKNKEDFKIFFEYVAANKIFEDDPGFRERVQEFIKRAESGDEGSLAEISNAAKRCLNGQKQILQILDIHFDVFDFESRYIRNRDVQSVLEFLMSTEFARTTDKGFGLDLKEFGLERRGGITTLARTDWTSVYLSRDIAYHLEKSKIGDEMINILGEDHKFEFMELKTILREIYKLENPLQAVHYSFVSFDGAELSTRKGLTAPVDMLIDDSIEKARYEVKKRKIATEDVANDIGIGAIKYHILKTSPMKPITFRWDEALSFEGNASPYIQYAHARCCSILDKSKYGLESLT